MDIFKEFRFEAAHRLTKTPQTLHKCRRLHGHSYRVEIHVTGTPDARTGWIVDFSEIVKAWQPGCRMWGLCDMGPSEEGDE